MNSRNKRPKRARRYSSPTATEIANRRAFHETAHFQRCCQKCGDFGEYQSHHVVEKAELKRVDRRDLEWDTRNAMRLCPGCHAQHTAGMDRVPMGSLTDEHIRFAFYVLGARAYSYLSRMYAGHDERLDAYLENWKEEHGAGEPGTATGI